MDQMELKEFIKSAKNNIAILICGNDSNQFNELINCFNSKVNIILGQHSENVNFAAHTGGSIIYEFNNKKLLVQNSNITVNLPNPPNKNTVQFNGWMVDVHHELFHAFTKLMSGIKECESEGDIYYAPAGGKISLLKYAGNNRFDNIGDVHSSVLFNELTTDLIAYICTYKSAEGIFHSNNLEVIDERYGHYNGYYELLQLGLVIFNAFANFPADYDILLNNGKGMFNCKYNGDITIFYNDLLHGVLQDPIYLKNQFMKYSSENDWEELNKISFAILRDFRTINENDIYKLMIIMKRYFDKKIQDIEEKSYFSKNIIEQLKLNFNQRYNYAKKYYDIPIERSTSSGFCI